MIRKYKALSLAMMALFAFGAIAAQSASANPLTVGEGAATLFVTGTSDPVGSTHTLTVEPGLSVECTHSLYRGSAAVTSGAVNHITLTPEYTNCKAFGFATAHVSTAGCVFTLTTPTSLVKGTSVTWHPSQIHVVCEGTKKITITPTSFGVSVCTASVGTQTPTAGHLVSKNLAATNELTDEATVEGVAYTSTSSPCGKGGNTAKFIGNTTTTCWSNAAHTVKVSCRWS